MYIPTLTPAQLRILEQVIALPIEELRQVVEGQ